MLGNKDIKEIVRYIIAGGMTTVVSLASYYIVGLTVLNPENPLQLQIINIISWICAVSFAFVTNRKYVFGSNASIMSESIKFFASRVSTLVIDMLLMFLMVTVFLVNDKIAKILVQFVVFLLNYIFSKVLVFRYKDEN